MRVHTLQLDDGEALERVFTEQLSQGRVFLPGAVDVVDPAPCELVLAVAAHSHRVRAEVVFVKEEDPHRGIGLQIARDAATIAGLRAFLAAAKSDHESAPDGERRERLAVTVQDRIRSLSSIEQQKLAASGTLPERIALERMFGPNVWETLLRNPRLTIPEVMRIARKGTLPRPLVETIAANAAWLATPEVQRALLANPRTSIAIATRILHGMSRPDLALVEQQTAYPASIRQAAKKLRGP